MMTMLKHICALFTATFATTSLNTWIKTFIRFENLTFGKFRHFRFNMLNLRFKMLKLMPNLLSIGGLQTPQFQNPAKVFLFTPAANFVCQSSHPLKICQQ